MKVLVNARHWQDRIMLLVLLGLSLVFSLATLKDQEEDAVKAAARLAPQAVEAAGQAPLLVLARGGAEDRRFLAAMLEELRLAGRADAETLSGAPSRLRAGLVRVLEHNPQSVIVTSQGSAAVVEQVSRALPAAGALRVLRPQSRRWPTFLLRDNLLNVANQIAVIAILAIGMTVVILTAGIDLSVGSLIALAAVVCAKLVGLWGGQAAGAAAMLAAGALAVLLCGVVGAFSGLMITRWRVPPFIATLGMMQVASGLAYLISQGRPVYQLPPTFTTLGRAAAPGLGLPWAVLLMLALYALAHLIMTRSTVGRYIYAVGGNAEAARLAGVPVTRVLMGVYVACALLAGLGGVLMASQLRSGAPTYGGMYELYVIAAVVVGGTSLSGGQGRMLGTLTGAFIIAVIQNGMNLTNVESYTQKVVLGLVILGAVLIERINGRRA